MADTLILEIATPERLLLHEHVTEVQIPASTGYVGILPGHAPLLSALGTGEMTYRVAGGGEYSIAVSDGYLEVSRGHVRVLAVVAEHAGEIDEERALEALRRASEALAHPATNLEIARALNSMKRARARLDALKHRAGVR